MKAIVLTYDRYHPFADHMIHSYSMLWPDHPLVFRVPYQSYPAVLNRKYGDSIELIKTDSGIINSVLKLLEDLDENEWVYWCIDDKYPIELQTERIRKMFDWLSSDNADNVDGVLFSYNQNRRRDKAGFGSRAVSFPGLGDTFVSRSNYSMIWIHQFIRVKVLRNLFTGFSSKINNAKQMDHLKDEVPLPASHHLYATQQSLAVFGESTHRGKITLNCYKKFEELGWDVPEEFQLSEKEILIGDDSSDELRIIRYAKKYINKIFQK